MTNNVPFDTLAYAKKLEARGVEVKQAEAHAEILAEVLEASFQTKKGSDGAINNLSHEVSSLRSEMHHEINSLRSEMHHEINSLRSEMNMKFAEVKSDIIKWVFGISFAQAALIISLLKFFH
ncbi:MAG: hypothetical protein EPO11_06840 [Gammaproteobacteria bacterium]|nr:MAG: hypothetical protein EPO11_06840 [Gammaproteobacteria bacterium]